MMKYMINNTILYMQCTLNLLVASAHCPTKYSLKILANSTLVLSIISREEVKLEMMSYGLSFNNKEEEKLETGISWRIREEVGEMKKSGILKINGVSNKLQFSPQ